MTDFPAQIRHSRLRMGLSQSALAHAAGISLPSVQKLETGRANPSLSLLGPICKVLGLELSLRSAPVDWDVLAYLGVPLSSTSNSGRAPSTRPTALTLARQLRLAAAELDLTPSAPEHARKRDALAATLLALLHDYPTFYRTHCEGAPVIQAMVSPHSQSPGGRIIKLKRLALARLSEYL